MKIAIIGGGAAGFFAAIQCQKVFPEYQVFLFEKTHKPLAKVRVSGGGRCNVTHQCKYVSELIKHYPRGGKRLKSVFSTFGVQDTIQWFNEKGVQLKTESDGRMFPISDDSKSIIDALWKGVKDVGVKVVLGQKVIKILPQKPGFELWANESLGVFDKLILATGGQGKKENYQWLRQLGISIKDPVPSLFTFNIREPKLNALMGIATKGMVKIPGISNVEKGDILITHWGLSGPVILRLSAWLAKELAKKKYHFNVLINWLPEIQQDQIKPLLAQNAHKKLKNNNVFELPNRLWYYLIQNTNIDLDHRWINLSKSSKNKLSNALSQDTYEVKGKTTFKEEFVTCGGVSLDQINLKTMESLVYPGLYFAGELLDIDGVTGGFNFQAAWSTGFIAGSLGERIEDK